MATKATKTTKQPKRRKLPARIMLDSGVVLRALDHESPTRKKDPHVKECRELWSRALQECRVLIPPFVVLELLAGQRGATAFPVVRAIEHVAFSYQVAEQMAAWATPSASAETAKATSTSRRVVGYDALIVGTAKFHGADVLVTLDDAVVALATAAGMNVARPRELLSWQQQSLPFPLR